MSTRHANILGCFLVLCLATLLAAGTGGCDKGSSAADVAEVKGPDTVIADVVTTELGAETDEGTDATPDNGGEVDALGPDLPKPECTEATVAVDCQDLDTCTDDRCEGGQCVNAPIPGCCKTDSQCDDGVACTVDSCNTILKQCQFLAGSNLCCLSAADCDDGEACTDDLCAAHQCVFLRRTSDAVCACSSNTQCDDGNDCTTDSCLEGVCSHEATSESGCCGAAGGCDDGDATTYDACQYGSCWNAALPCAVDADCLATDACLAGACTDGVCTFEVVDYGEEPGCCTHDGQCDDGVTSTLDACVGGQCVHRIGAATSCTTDGECPAASACVASSCATTAGQCTEEAVQAAGCCAAATDCPASGDFCSAATCDALACGTAALSGEQPWWQEGFGSGVAGSPVSGWTVVDDGSGARWQTGGAQAISAPASLYYGKLPDMNYDVGTNAGSATSGMLSPPAGVTATSLVFWVAGDIEPISSRDQLWVDVVVDGVATMVWSKDTAGGLGTSWSEQTVDVSAFAGAPFQLRVSFDTVDELNNTGGGVYLDEVRLTAPCP